LKTVKIRGREIVKNKRLEKQLETIGWKAITKNNNNTLENS
jgi:hypothetical protein